MGPPPILRPPASKIGPRQTEENAADLDEFDRRLARVDEVAQGADGSALDAQRAATQADEKATEARSQADDAHELAETSLGRIDAVERVIQDLDKYRQLGKESVLFAFGSSRLGESARTKLGGLMTKVAGHERYVIEVVGYTDSTGPAEFNLALSRSRADAVVRHLTVKHNVPPRRIFTIGLGDQVPVANNKTRERRRENRRVEVSVYVAEALNH